MFSCEFCEISLRTSFLQNTTGRLLLCFCSYARYYSFICEFQKFPQWFILRICNISYLCEMWGKADKLYKLFSSLQVLILQNRFGPKSFQTVLSQQTLTCSESTIKTEKVWNMFKTNKKRHQNHVIDFVLVSLLLTLNIFHFWTYFTFF